MPQNNLSGIQRPKHLNSMVTHAIRSHERRVAGAGVYNGYTHSLDTNESQRNYRIAAHLNEKNFRGYDKQRVVLPGDGRNPQTAQQNRTRTFWRQSGTRRLSQFMRTSTDMNRLNNPAQSSFVKQPQRRGPNSAQQFVAFMHAMSAAFGSLQQ